MADYDYDYDYDYGSYDFYPGGPGVVDDNYDSYDFYPGGPGVVDDNYDSYDFHPGGPGVVDDNYDSYDFGPGGPGAESSGISDTIRNLLSSIGSSAVKALSSVFQKPNNGGTDWSKVAAAAGGLYGAYQSQRPQEKTGYQGGIPKYEAVQEAVQNTYDPSRRPGSGGQRYFSNTKFVNPADAAAARSAASQEAEGLASLNRNNPARESRSPTEQAVDRAEESSEVQEGRAASSVIEDMPVPRYAQGGIATLAQGGTPRYLAGGTDGMADKIPARIDDTREARLSHGEFVIPADVVSHFGNGNSEAGAERLYSMMDKIRKARTGNSKQGKEIDPNKFMLA